MEALPFESVTFTQAEHDIAARVLAHYDNKPQRWTQGALARDIDGNPQRRTQGTPVCWCIEGAAICTSPELGTLAAIDCIREAARKALNRADDRNFTLVGWQDAPTRTFFEVRDLLESIVAGPVAE